MPNDPSNNSAGLDCRNRIQPQYQLRTRVHQRIGTGGIGLNTMDAWQ